MTTMLIVGVVLTATAALTLAAPVPLFRAQQPPRWTRSRLVGEMATLALVGTFTLGLACLGVGVYRAYQSGPTLIELGVVALALGLAVVLWRRVGVRQPAVAPAMPTLVAATEVADPAPQEPQPPRPAAPTRRAA
jgi:hypothetical protein